ncbi:tetratricopeptide repeat protein [Thermopirellula anaerolimosa]
MRSVQRLLLFKSPARLSLIGGVLVITVLAGLLGHYRVGLLTFRNPVAEHAPASKASAVDGLRAVEMLKELPDESATVPRSAGDVREEMRRLAEWLKRWYPDAADAGIISGRLCYHLGEMDAAEEAFQSVLRLDSDNVHAHHGLALIDVARSRFEQAVPHFRRAVALSPGTIGPMLELADALIRTGRIDEAVELLEKDFPSELESVWRFQMLGQCYLHRGDLRRARMMYELALLLEPDDPVALTGLVTVFSRLDDDEQTAIYTERLRRVREREREAARQTRRTHDDATALAGKLAEAYGAAGRFCLVQGDDKPAERLLLRALGLRPDDGETHRDLAELFLNRGDRRNEAVVHAEAAASALRDATTNLLLARAYDAAGRSQEALEAVRRALAGGERRADALALYRRLTESRPQDAPGNRYSEVSAGFSERP